MAVSLRAIVFQKGLCDIQSRAANLCSDGDVTLIMAHACQDTISTEDCFLTLLIYKPPRPFVDETGNLNTLGGFLHTGN